MMIWNAKWLEPIEKPKDAATVYTKNFSLIKAVKKATLYITALGVYEAVLNGRRVGQFILAPGWTSYHKRLQYQSYDVTGLLRAGDSTTGQKEAQNCLQVMVGKGWYRSPMPGWGSRVQEDLSANPPALLAQLEIAYEDGSAQYICSDESWREGEGPVRFSEIYDGEIYDARIGANPDKPVAIFEGPWDTLIPQQGEEIREQEHISVFRIFTTPKGETVADFGQEVTGYVETRIKNARPGDTVDLSFAEVMDKEGNFYNENYRGAKAQYHYICREGNQIYKPKFSFWGFRYIRINQFPGGVSAAKPECFTAIVLHSQMERTGYLRCSNALLNRLFDNCIWGQKGNFLDVPTDCPQRDERLGWTGDAQVFVRTACLNYDAERFFTKWLADMSADQGEDGYIGHVIPDILHNPDASAAWGDAATICPWEIYLAYGNPEILGNQYECMHKWVDYITAHTTKPGLWTGGTHYGDWLALDFPTGNYEGASRKDFIASAFYAHSTLLVIKAGRILGKDVSAYEALYQKILEAFRSAYPTCETQTECVLAAHFNLAADPRAAADKLAGMIRDCGVHLKTGFVGTPYLLHVLSRFGYTDLAYSLLLREDYPSWLYPVTKGATTVWEHWDGIMENGDFWSADMNSFNHYAYGSVEDWVYGVAAGIKTLEEAPGYANVKIAPIPDTRLEWLEASLKTRHGLIRSGWKRQDGMWRYEIVTPVCANIIIAGKEYKVDAGTYYFYSE